MEVTVYADVLMAVNFLIDYLLLLFCGRLGGRAIFRRRLLLGALIGALVSLVIFLPPLPFWAMTGVKLLSAAAMVALAFRWQGVRGFCWDVFLFFTVSFLLAGICLGLWLGFGAGGLFCRNGVTYFQVSLPVLLGTVSGAYLLLTLYDRLRRSPTGETAAVTLSRNGRTIRLRALRDSGNRLKEPFSGSPVAVAELAPVLSLLTEEEAAAALAPDYPTGESLPSLRPVPCRTVQGAGLLPAFRPDRVEVTGAGEDPAAVLLVEDLMVAVTPGPLGDGRCQLLLPADYSAIPVRREEKCLLYPRG